MDLADCRVGFVDAGFQVQAFGCDSENTSPVGEQVAAFVSGGGFEDYGVFHVLNSGDLFARFKVAGITSGGHYDAGRGFW